MGIENGRRRDPPAVLDPGGLRSRVSRRRRREQVACCLPSLCALSIR